MLCSGTVYLHAIDPANDRVPQNQESINLPERDDQPRISCIGLSNDFLIYGSEAGTINYFHLDEWRTLVGSEYRHTAGIIYIAPNANATRIAFIDKNHNGYLFNPVDGHTIQV